MSSICIAPLPAFSGHAQKLLLDKRPEDDWALNVSQAADYYFAKFPTIGSPRHYKEICLKMYQTYPCISQAGKHPWVRSSAIKFYLEVNAFCLSVKCLSKANDTHSRNRHHKF